MKQRPLGILVICLLGMIGVIMLIGGGFLCLFGAEAVHQLIQQNGGRSDISVRLLGVMLAFGCWIYAAVHGLIVRGLFRLRPWARFVMMLISLVSLSSLFHTFSVVTLIVSGGTFWYLAFNERVRAAFR